jgi:hypothetical protein
MLLAGFSSVPTRAADGQGGVRSIMPMVERRSCHSATLLNDGTVLIAGGFVSEGRYLRSAELYDPVAGTFSATGSMTEARACHTATLLPDGRVLMLGSWTTTWLDSAEVYDPATRRFTSMGVMTEPRSGFTATLLPDGRVLIAGGMANRRTLNSAELFDPQAGTFTSTGQMTAARTAHTATLLPDGRVLIAGGAVFRGEVLASADLYDPTTGQFTATGDLVAARHKHAAVWLPSGEVVLFGGASRDDWRGRLRSVELYDVATGTFGAAGQMREARFKFGDAVALLSDGRVLIAGGHQQIEVFDPSREVARPAEGTLDADRFYQTATVLPDGNVLITGGYSYDIQASDGAWLYQP